MTIVLDSRRPDKIGSSISGMASYPRSHKLVYPLSLLLVEQAILPMGTLAMIPLSYEMNKEGEDLDAYTKSFEKKFMCQWRDE
jgi:hypothetical protein